MRTALLLALSATACRARAPLLSLSANGSERPVVYRGWPIVVDSAVHPADETPVALAVREGHWAASLKLAVSLDGAGAGVPFRLLEPYAGSGPVTLDAMTPARLVWLMSPEDSNHLPPGKSLLRLVLETRQTAAEGHGAGLVQCPAVRLEMQVPPETGSAGQDAGLALLKSFCLDLSGLPQDALSEIQSLLEQQPGNSAALARKAGLPLNAALYVEAIAAYSEAINAFKPHLPDATHPPRELVRPQSEAQWRAAGIDP